MRYILVGGGDFAQKKFLAEAKTDDIIIAVDKGFEYLQGKSNFVIGDFDSLGYVPQGKNVIVSSARKDYTDMQLALDFVLSQTNDKTKVIIFGGLGGRLDHTLSNIQNSYNYFRKGLDIELVGNHEKIVFVDKTLTLKKENTGVVSNFSLDHTEGVYLDGFSYPLSNATLTNIFPIGQSNELAKETATISVKSGILMVIINDKN